MTIDVSRGGIIVGKIQEEKRNWRVIGVYVKKNMKEILNELRRWVGEKEEKVETIGGDFNARIREEGGVDNKGENELRERRLG